MYGVLDFIDDICEDTGQKAFNVKWATRHLLITMDSWNHLCAVLEGNIEIVRKPDEVDALLYNLYQTKDFFCKVNGVYDLKEYNATCEYCRITSCDIMTFREESDHEYE